MKTKIRTIITAALLLIVSIVPCAFAAEPIVVVGVFGGIQYTYQASQVDYSGNATDRLVAVWVRKPSTISGFDTEAAQIKMNCPQRRWTFIGAAMLFIDKETGKEMSKFKVIENLGSAPIDFSADNLVQTLYWQLCGKQI